MLEAKEEKVTETVVPKATEWYTMDGDDIEVGGFVHVAIPLFEDGKRPMDYGRVYDLLDDGRVRVLWFSAEEAFEPDVEECGDLQLSTEEIAEGFKYGHDLGYETGYREGGMTQLNAQRSVLGMEPLTTEQFEQLIDSLTAD